MKDFTMSDSSMKTSPPIEDLKRAALEGTIEAGDDGRLCIPQIRRLLTGRVPNEAMPALEAFSALVYAARLLHQGMERWAEKEGLSETRLQLMALLLHLPDGAPLGALATRMHVSPRNVTGLVDNLERDGLVARVPDPADRRSVLAQLTDRGREVISGLFEESVHFQRDLLADFTPAELGDLRHLCLKIVQKLETRKTGK